MPKKHAPTEVLSFSKKLFTKKSVEQSRISFKNTCFNESNNMPVEKMSK